LELNVDPSEEISMRNDRDKTLQEENLRRLGRAITHEEKKAIVQRLLMMWTASPNQRLGQFIFNAMCMSGTSRTPSETFATDMFYIEDSRLAEIFEKYMNWKSDKKSDKESVDR
jgi:hypothetical protein